MKYSIVIPTYNHCDDFLKPCVESIISYSDMSQVEICISANGCTDNTIEYIKELEKRYPENIKYTWNDASLGYSKATNRGIKIATGEYVVLLNNDTKILPSERNVWLERLSEPLKDPDVGVTGIIPEYNQITKREFLIFFCVMMKRNLFKEIGLIDEDFGLGGCEDTEFCYRAEKAGYKIKGISKLWLDEGATHFTSDFPIFHQAEGTMFDKQCVDVNLDENKVKVEALLYEKTREPIQTSHNPRIILTHRYSGLGDHLTGSTLPEIYTKKGYDVYMSADAEFRNPDVEHLIMMNPYIKGYSARPATIDLDTKLYDGTYPFHQENKNYIARIEQSVFGEVFNDYPKIYYTPNNLPEWNNKVFVDFNSVSITDHDLPKFRQLVKQNHGEYIEQGVDFQTKDIFEYIDIINSCKKFICTYTGSSVLSAAVNKNNVDCYVGEQWIRIIRSGGYCFHHDNINYINVDNIDNSIINVKLKQEEDNWVNNYQFDEHGVVHQIQRKPFHLDYGKVYKNRGEMSNYISYLRLGFILGSIPDSEKCSSILDVGFGNGDFLRASQKRFSVCSGMDLTWDYLPENCSRELSPTDNYYDIITFFDSLEHFDDINFVADLKCKYLVISVPNCKLWSLEWFKDWKHRKPNEHLHHFNLDSLTKFLNASGFEIIKSECFEDVIRKDKEENNILSVIAKKKTL